MSDFLTWVVFNWNHQCLTGLCCFLFLKTWHIVTYWLISQDLIWICSHCQMLPNSFLFYIAASNLLFQPHHETSQANQPNPPNQPNQPNQLKPAQPATVNPWFWNWPITPPTPPMEEKTFWRQVVVSLLSSIGFAIATGYPYPPSMHRKPFWKALKQPWRPFWKMERKVRWLILFGMVLFCVHVFPIKIQYVGYTYIIFR